MIGKMNRREFTKGAAAFGAAVACTSVGKTVLGANERIRLGVIGVGNRGDQLIDALLGNQDAQIVALCDVYEPHLQFASQKVGGKPRLYGDYRKLLEQKDVDAVVIATPDHWHALQFVDACRAGKDVYQEKPLSRTIAEGRKMVTVAEETGRVNQIGTHRRSDPCCQQAVELIRDGAIGQVTVAKCYHLRNEWPMGIGNPSDCDPPAGLDWNMWLGPAPKVPYNPNRCPYKFRWFWDYSGGQLTNFGTHFVDMIQWALGQEAPKGVFASGGNFAIRDNREIPDTMEVVWEYENALVTMSQYNANRCPGNPTGAHVEFRGTKGTLLTGYSGFEIIPEKTRTRELPALSPLFRKENREQGRATRIAREPLKVKGKNATANHVRNFLDCVKSRKPTNCPVSVGHRSTSATLLARIALHRGRYLVWDSKKEQVVNDPQANDLLMYEYRSPWRLV